MKRKTGSGQTCRRKLKVEAEERCIVLSDLNGHVRQSNNAIGCIQGGYGYEGECRRQKDY